MFKKILLLTIWISFIWGISYAQDEQKVNISPIVQLVSYKDVFGKYVEMFWRWSASIINDKGIIISNNHVVDNWKWNLASAFSVCITKKYKERPVCDYTASLIDRDDTMDISILKINPYDIYWNKVDYSKFAKIDIDYDYAPVAQDELLAVGYPWIGADTITQTKWIVSWISEYNWFNYIKTDTIIAWWNSWWGLLNSKWKLIWIPTFGIWWVNDPSLGYALSIADAKDFIESNIDKVPDIKETKIDFAWYRATIDKINSQQYLKDDIFDFKFDSTYEIKNYIKNQKIELNTKKNKEISINSMDIEIINTFDISKDKDFLFYIEKLWYYNKQYDKLQKVTIWWLTFYSPVSLQDASGGKSDSNKLYVTRLSKNSILVVLVTADFSDEKNNKKLQEEIKTIFEWIKFDTQNLLNISSDFILNSPLISITKAPSVVLNDRYWVVQWFFWDLNNNFIISILERDLSQWKWQTIQDVYKAETNSVNWDDYKSVISFKWHPWFAYCLNVYNPQVDINWNSFDQQNCYMKIYWFTGINNEEFYLNISLNADKNKIKQYFDYLNLFLDKNLIVSSIWDWKTNLVNILANQVTLNFQDISYQKKWFVDWLKYLVKYNLVKNWNKFNGDVPLKWADFIDMYSRMVYGFDLYKNKTDCKNDIKCYFEKYNFQLMWNNMNLMKIIDEMGINIYDYVDETKVTYFQTYFDLKLAWAQLPEFSEYFLSLYSGNSQEKFFEEQKTKINALNNELYWYRKILIYDLISDVASYNTNLSYFYSFAKGLVEKQIKSNWKISFVSDKNAWLLSLTNCLLSKTSATKCFLNYKNDYLDDWYKVLTKWKAIDLILPLIDFSMFDESLKLKKDTIISDED